MKNKKLLRLLAAVALATSGLVQADVVSLSNISAQWYDGSPVANVSYYNNPSAAPSARWGVGEQQSGYDFTVASQPILFDAVPSPSPTQVLGTFSHQNFPINAGTSIDSIKLRITADIAIDSVAQGSRVFDYGFNHWETSNGAYPCADGGTDGYGVNINGCADRVIANWLSSSEDFTVGAEIYTLNVLGFSLNLDGSNPFTSFWTAERRSNNAYLLANVALRRDVDIEIQQIPEPASVSLIGLGLLGLVGARRKAKAQ